MSEQIQTQRHRYHEEQDVATEPTPGEVTAQDHHQAVDRDAEDMLREIDLTLLGLVELDVAA